MGSSEDRRLSRAVVKGEFVEALLCDKHSGYCLSFLYLSCMYLSVYVSVFLLLTNKLLLIRLFAADYCSPADEQLYCGLPYLLKTRVTADRLLNSIKHLMLLISKSSAALDS
ncbi:hypothetical protein L1987_64992 [Smallanthus sonchifolius]|uniref:Uncharacterized protein n=1 Tax=Smallanthus sonchifolius TaxID=185202 RepID=A0ACB9BTG9_9ASTR|nr:hypothetical protein L1987_64992 [Smallanthus sonchifolius]